MRLVEQPNGLLGVVKWDNTDTIEWKLDTAKELLEYYEKLLPQREKELLDVKISITQQKEKIRWLEGMLRKAPAQAGAKPVIDCGKVDCDWYDEGRGYEECKWCSRFSRQISRETSKSLITDRYSPKQAQADKESE